MSNYRLSLFAVLSAWSIFIAVNWNVKTVFAYIPALPTNTSGTKGGPNITDTSKLSLQWYSGGSYSENVSYQLAGNNSDGISQGALVHFSEEYANNGTEPTTTPWIALVACDQNATGASMEIDVFTLARDKGAKSALLYSRYSEACVINAEYADPDTFDQVMDIFSTQSLTSASLILYQFGQFGSMNTSLYSKFNSQMLNQSGTVINDTIRTGNPTTPGYLFATLRSSNATGTTASTNGSPNSTGQPTGSSGGSGNTGTAMIILYAITGCVSALFCVVIISGAIRAMRHPERYGPRSGVSQNGGPAEPGQSRARGLTRAILDTFPVVKFDTAQPRGATQPREQPKDIEFQSASDRASTAVEMAEWEVVDAAIERGELGGGEIIVDNGEGRSTSSQRATSPGGPKAGGVVTFADQTQQQVSGPDSRPTPHRSSSSASRPRGRPSLENKEVVMDNIGRETCPICIVDFEEGDDLRQLPCEGKHRFHQECVDPWLLELSSSCPICRQDFQALETMLSGETDDGHHSETSDHVETEGPTVSRFSRYLRFARRRRDEEEDIDSVDPHVANSRR